MKKFYLPLYIIIFLMVTLNLYSQTEPDIIFEKTFNIEDDYSMSYFTTTELHLLNSNYYLTYNFVDTTPKRKAGVIKFSLDFEIISQVEFRNSDKFLENIFLFNEKEYLLSFETRKDEIHPNYIEYYYPVFNILEDDTVSSSIYGDAINQGYTNCKVDVRNDIIHLFTEKEIIIESDTIKKRFIDRYDFNLDVMKSIEIDTQGYAINDPLFPDAFIALNDGSYLVSQRGPFIDFNLIYKHGAMTKFDYNSNLLWSKKVFQEEISWYYNLYQYSDGTVFASGYHRLNSNSFFTTLTKYDKSFEIDWTKSIDFLGNPFHFYTQNEPLNDGKFIVSYGGMITNPVNQESKNALRIFDSEGNELQLYVWGETENSFVIRKVFYDEKDNSLIVFSVNGEENFKIYKIGNFTSVNDNIENDRILISPNPVQDELRIENYEIGINYNIEIYNVLSEKVLTANISENNSINVSHLTPGVYFIKIGDKVEKFVKE
jgi:hypothetical protein